MRPYADNGKTPKKRSRRGEKAINGVKKSLTKAKVTAVKTKRRMTAKDAEEVEDLLEQTANGHPATPAGKAIASKVKSTPKASTAGKEMKKLKSLVKVSVAGERKSERLQKKQAEAASTNGKVEVAQEAMEINGSSGSGGLLQRTISKIWRLPEGITGVPYSDIQQQKAEPASNTNGHQDQVDSGNNASRGSCVIS